MPEARKKKVGKSVQEYGRGVVGGLLFSLPMLYTMEVWWAGFIAGPTQLLLLLVVTFFLLLGYNRYAGMRADSTWAEVAIDSVEEMGLGLVISFVVLLKLGRIELHHLNWSEDLGKVVVEAMIVAIGVSVGTAQLGAKGQNETQDQNQAGSENDNSESGMQDRTDSRPSLVGKAVLALCGSILVAGNVAPTEEIILIAYEIQYWRALALVLESVLVAAVVQYFIAFSGTRSGTDKNTLWHMALDTSMVYLIALGSSAFMLWFFGRFASVSFDSGLLSVVVLAFPGTLGASAGRLLLK